MATDNGMRQLLGVVASLAALALVTAAGKVAAGLNATTMVLLYLLVVLAASALADLRCGIVVAAVSGLLVDYYFLPPFGTFHVEAPEDWVALAVYGATAVVVSRFAATVRRNTVDADRRQDELARLTRLTEALMALPPERLTLQALTAEVRQAYGLSCCAIFLLAGGGSPSPVIAGTWPARPASDSGEPSSPPRTALEAVTEGGAAVRCLDLKDHGGTMGALVLSQIPLSAAVATALAAVVALVVRQCPSSRQSE